MHASERANRCIRWPSHYQTPSTYLIHRRVSSRRADVFRFVWQHWPLQRPSDNIGKSVYLKIDQLRLFHWPSLASKFQTFTQFGSVLNKLPKMPSVITRSTAPGSARFVGGGGGGGLTPKFALTPRINSRNFIVSRQLDFLWICDIFNSKLYFLFRATLHVYMFRSSFKLSIYNLSTHFVCQAICTQRTPKGPK